MQDFVMQRVDCINASNICNGVPCCVDAENELITGKSAPFCHSLPYLDYCYVIGGKLKIYEAFYVVGQGVLCEVVVVLFDVSRSGRFLEHNRPNLAVLEKTEFHHSNQRRFLLVYYQCVYK